MRSRTMVILGILALAASAWMLMAQGSHDATRQEERPTRRERPPGPPGSGPHRQPPPVIAVLDANRDGVIDAQEIANASKALLQLDLNGDGKLTREELRPPPPSDQGDPNPDGPPPFGPPGEN